MKNRIKEFRSQLNLSQAAMVEGLKPGLEVRPSALGNWENGIRDPNLAACRCITGFFLASGLEVTIDDVFPAADDCESAA